MSAERAEAERKALVGLAEQCAGLPLAIRICAANLASRPHTTVDMRALPSTAMKPTLSWLRSRHLIDS